MTGLLGHTGPLEPIITKDGVEGKNRKACEGKMFL
jgi:hypothetical protein